MGHITRGVRSGLLGNLLCPALVSYLSCLPVYRELVIALEISEKKKKKNTDKKKHIMVKEQYCETDYQS